MKKNLFSLVLLFWVFTCTAQMELKINPLGTLYSKPTLSVDVPFSEFISIEPSVGLSFNNSILVDEDFASKGRNYGLNGKFYLNPSKGCDRLYTGIYVRGDRSEFTGKDVNAGATYSCHFSALGFSFGYKLVSKQNIVFDFGLGFGRKLNFKETVPSSSSTGIIVINSSESAYSDGFMRLAVGYRFGRGNKQ
jgi:hypothetical protein